MGNKIEDYNTNELGIAEYAYYYTFNYHDSRGENSVTVEGKRRGIVYSYNEDEYFDLISGFVINKESLTSFKPFVLRDTTINLQVVKNIFGDIENVYGYTAVECVAERSSYKPGDLYFCVPYGEFQFKASENKLGIVEEFKRKVELKKEEEPQCELDRIIKKAKNRFRRN